MKVVRDSGFGYPLAYPRTGPINLLFTIKKGDDRIIMLEYQPYCPLRRVLRSQLHTLEPRTRKFVESLTALIDTGFCDSEEPLHLDLYKTMAHEE